ncbi:MAG: FumA C-terminus/TtdB family hydratase beta subunit [Candidatus Micrarchaeia archaeon]
MFRRKAFVKGLVELYRRCATELPEDVSSHLYAALKKEKSVARFALSEILRNCEISRKTALPICQDTGMPIFFVCRPKEVGERELFAAIKEATRIATRKVPLRSNATDALTGKNSGDNTGVMFPLIHFKETDESRIRISLMLKGGGSENICAIYKLPDKRIGAERDINGVRLCVLDAVLNAQGRGCPPYLIGVGVGGACDATLALAKEQLLLPIDAKNKNRRIRALEKRLLSEINSLGIGPLGLGGKTTAISVKIAFAHRHVASYFVAIAFSCWACRRGEMAYDLRNGKIRYKIGNTKKTHTPVIPVRFKKIKLPPNEEEIKQLRVGDFVSLSGVLYTMRDMAHRYALENDMREKLGTGYGVYHCGPIMRKTDGNYEVVAAGPTTSARMNRYIPLLIERYGVRVIIGKGGLGDECADALKKHGAVYLSAIGGAAQTAAAAVKNVEGVFMLEEFGMAEAIWKLRVDDFRALVTMDSTGASLHKNVEASSRNKFSLLFYEKTTKI